MSELLQDSPRDPQVSRLYREFSTAEPSAALDQRVLAAARTALADRSKSVRSQGWWQRWRTPLALTTTLALSLTLALLHERQPGPVPVERAVDRQLPDVRRDAPGTKAVEQAKPELPAAPAAAPAAATVAIPAAAPANSQPETTARVARPSLAVGEHDARAGSQVAAEQASPVVADYQARSAAPAAAPAVAPAEAKRESLPASPAAKSKGGVAGAVDEARLDNAVTPTPAMRESAAALGKLRAEVPRSPAAWLEEIRALMREGKAEEAARQLREFRRTHPDYPLPEEFRQ